MKHSTQWRRGLGLLATLLCLLTWGSSTSAQPFTNLFDGKTLNGWKLLGAHGSGVLVRDGVIVFPADGGGKLMTEREYSDFAFRFEFKLTQNGNNGVAIRAPLEGDAAYNGMESQILDDSGPAYTNLLPAQYHGSLYKVAAAKRGAQKPVGEWNRQEIIAVGRHFKIILNGQTIVDADLNKVSDPAILAEHGGGMFRDKGYLGFLGHGPSEVQLRNISVRDLSKAEKENRPPKGFQALFNGKDLKGWKGLVKDPPNRAKMSAEALRAAEVEATTEALKHWKVVDGVITYDGKNNNLCSEKDYTNFEMLVDWKIGPHGDSGIYLRGSPQIQIWDRTEGSGGLYNNQKNPANPLKNADNPTGQWNRFRIIMVGEKVWVYLNNELVVNNVTMENYWERSKPIYPSGALELQHHGDPIFFKNIYVREIK